MPKFITEDILTALVNRLISKFNSLFNGWAKVTSGTPNPSVTDDIYHNGKVIVGTATDDGSGAFLQARNISTLSVNNSLINNQLYVNNTSNTYTLLGSMPSATGGATAYYVFTLSFETDSVVEYAQNQTFYIYNRSITNNDPDRFYYTQVGGIAKAFTRAYIQVIERTGGSLGTNIIDVYLYTTGGGLTVTMTVLNAANVTLPTIIVNSTTVPTGTLLWSSQDNEPIMFLDKVGQLGLGIVPTAKLHVIGNALISGNVGIAQASDSRFGLTVGMGTVGSAFLNGPVALNNTLTGKALSLYDATANANQFMGFGTLANAFIFQTNGNSQSYVWQTATSPTTSAELMRLTGDGKLGVNQSAPQYAIDAISTDGNGVIAQFIATAGGGAKIILQQQGVALWRIGQPANVDAFIIEGWDSGAYPERFRIDINGNVGIGTQAPNRKLLVVDNRTDGVTAMFQGGGSNGAKIAFNLDGISIWHIGLKAGQDTFVINGYNEATYTEYFSISSSGRVGIGTSSPTEQLHVNGNIQTIGFFKNDSTIANRKLVMYQNADNDHEFYGMGVNGNIFRLQIPEGASYIWYVASSPTTSQPIMQLTNSGILRVGNTVDDGSNALFQVNGDASVLGSFISQNGYFINKYNGQILSYLGVGSSSSGSYTDVAWRAELGSIIFASAGGTRQTLVLTQTNKAGFGTNNPQEQIHATSNIRTDAALQVRGTGIPASGQGIEMGYGYIGGAGSLLAYDRTNAIYKDLFIDGGALWLNNGSNGPVVIGSNTTNNKRLILYDTGGNQHQFYGFGINSLTLRSQIESTSAYFRWFAATSPTTSNEVMTLSGNGYLGVNRSTPQYAIDANSTDGNGVVAQFIGSGYHGSRLQMNQLNIAVWRIGQPANVDAFVIEGWGNGTYPERFRININGNVGINTNAPTDQLHVKATNGYQQFRMETKYTPTSSSDANGQVGSVAWDDNYTYVKTSAGWKRSALSTF